MKKQIHNQAHYQLIRYAVTAGIAAIVDLGGFLLLVQTGLPVILSAACSFLIATVVNYLLSARFVFSVKPKLSRYPLFLGGAVAGFIINVGVTTLGISIANAEPFWAKIAGIGLAFFANFALNRRIVFAR